MGVGFPQVKMKRLSTHGRVKYNRVSGLVVTAFLVNPLFAVVAKNEFRYAEWHYRFGVLHNDRFHGVVKVRVKAEFNSPDGLRF